MMKICNKMAKRSKFKPLPLIEAILLGWFALSLPIFTSAAPVLNHIAQGSAAVNQSPNTTVINQSSQKAIINWNSFNIGANETTHFQQPAGGVTLNRISPQQGASQIFGKLTATGQILLSNPAGIYFGPSSYVNVGGLIATTADIKDEHFMNNVYQFKNVSGYSGSVINEGHIVAKEHGLIALVAPGVINNGVIKAKLGHVILASGEAFTMNFSGDNLINFKIDAKTTQAGVDKDGNRLRNGVSNSGKILANGGTIIVSAKAASKVLDRVINLEGIVEARSVNMHKGTIIISGDTQSGVVRVASKINASGIKKNQKGGAVKITGHHILIDSPTVIDVRGDAGGGNITIGGNYQGKGPLPNANASVVAKGASLLADAITTGNGGNIIVWADQVTKVNGMLSARGGKLNGNGGFIETSGYKFLDINGIKVDVSASNGLTGTWLLDPEDVYITTFSTSGGSFDGNNPNIFTPTTDNSNILNTDIEDNLVNANVIITTGNIGSQAGDIFVNAPITWSSNNNLTLSAFRNIELNADITNTANANVVLQADNTGTGIGTVCGAGSVGCGGSATGVVNLNGSGNVSVYYNPAVFGTQDIIYTAGTAPIAYMLINTVGNLVALNGLDLGENYALGTDLDLSAISNFAPIGTFTGRFDGQSHFINNLTINDSLSNTGFGLFNYASGATITNLTLNQISMTLTGDNITTGGLIGSANNTSITNVNVDGNIILSGDINNQSTGGLVGYADNSSSLSNVNSSVVLDINLDAIPASNFNSIGGVVGNNEGSITNAHFNTPGSITIVIASNLSGLNVGGLLGYNTGNVNNATSAGSLSLTSQLGQTTENIGGLIGSSNNINSAIAIQNVISTTNVTTSGDNTAGTRNVGGLIGANAGSIQNALSSGLITVSGNVSTSSVYDAINNNYPGANQNIGGLIGSHYHNISFETISNARSTNNLTVTGDVSGLYGYSSSSNIGGLIGSNNGVLDNTGVLSPTTSGSIVVNGTIINNGGFNIGGVVGNSYYNDPIVGNVISNITTTSNLTITGDSTGGFMNIGGVLGSNTGSINSLTHTGAITVNSNMQSTLQSIYDPSTFSFSMAYTNANSLVGGIFGNNSSQTTAQSIQNIHSTGTITFNGNITGLPNNNSYLTIGGLGGFSRGNLTNSSSSGPIIVNADVNIGGLQIGGLIGTQSNISNITESVIQNNFSTSSISFNQQTVGVSNNSYIQVGGLIGYNQSRVIDNYYNGNILLHADYASGSGATVGGVAGFNDRDSSNPTTNVGILQDVTSAGTITFTQVNNGLQSGYLNIGGLAGGNRGVIDNAAVSGSSSNISISILLDVNGGGTGSSIAAGGAVGGNYYNNAIDQGFVQNVISAAPITVDQVTSNLQNNASISLGGLVAQNDGVIMNARSSGRVWSRINADNTVSLNFGGLVATNNTTGSIENSITSSSILVNGPGSTLSSPISMELSNGQLFVGGFAAGSNGNIDNTGISGFSNTGEVNIYADLFPGGGLTQIGAGGLIGINSTTSLISVKNGSKINLSINNNGGLVLVGGILGFSLVPISELTGAANITVQGSNNSGLLITGGLVGVNLASLNTSYSTGTVSTNILTSNNGITASGGLVGASINAGFGLPTISNAYNLASVTVRGQNNGGSVYTGGLIGSNGVANSPLGPLGGGDITNTYSAGSVNVAVTTTSGETLTGGLAGYNDTGVTITNSFWDVGVSGQSIGIAGGPGAVVGGAGGCFATTSCGAGSVVDLTQNSTYSTGAQYIVGAGWDFITTWGIINGASYPYLRAFNPGTTPRIFTGSVPNGNVGQMVNLVMNGQIIESASVGNNNSFYFTIPQNNITDGTTLLIYLDDALTKGNRIFNAPLSGGSATNLLLANNTLNIGDLQTTTISNSNLAVVLGNLLDMDILYSAAGTDISLGNATTAAVNWITSLTTNYLVDGNISSFTGTTTSFNFLGETSIGASSPTITATQNQTYQHVTLSSNLTLVSENAGAISLLNGITGNGYDLTLTGGTGSAYFSLAGIFNNVNMITINGNLNANNTLAINTPDQQQWLINVINGGRVSGLAGVDNGVTYNNIQNITGGTSQNTFNVINGGTLGGVLNGGTRVDNILSYAGYNGTLKVVLELNHAGYTLAGNNRITTFQQIGTVIGNNSSQLQLPANGTSLHITGPGSGYVTLPMNFSGFNTFIGSPRDRLIFDVTNYSYNDLANTASLDGYVMTFIGFSLQSDPLVNLNQVIQATYINRKYFTLFDSLATSVMINLAEIIQQQVDLDKKICVMVVERTIQLCSPISDNSKKLNKLNNLIATTDI